MVTGNDSEEPFMTPEVTTGQSRGKLQRDEHVYYFAQYLVFHVEQFLTLFLL